VNLGVSAYRFGQGDVVGGSLSLASAIPILGWAAVGVDVAREFGAFEGTPLGLKKEKPKNKIDERLKAQEKKQKEAASSSDVTFASITDKFDKVVSKFEKLKLGMTGIGSGSGGMEEGFGENSNEGGAPTPPTPPTEPYDGPISGDSFYPLPGGSLSTRANGYKGGEYGEKRGYGGHSGQDIGGRPPGSPVVAWKTGKIRYSGSVESGDTILTIDHGGGIESVYKHVVPTVPAGTTVYGGQQIATLFAARAYPEHLHFEIWKNGSHTNPNGPIAAAQKIPSPLTAAKAKEQHEKKIGNTAKPGVNTTQRQQSPEEFFKGTEQEDIFKDKEKRAQFFGEERQFKNTMVKTPVSDPEVKQALQMYNAYVRDIRSRRQDQVKAQPGDPIPAQILTPPPTAAQQSAIFLMGDQSQQVASQPQVVPVPVPTGNGGGGVAVIMPSEGQILNSLWTTMLLTNLSSA
jgi:hypothetical protein